MLKKLPLRGKTTLPLFCSNIKNAKKNTTNCSNLKNKWTTILMMKQTLPLSQQSSKNKCPTNISEIKKYEKTTTKVQAILTTSE